MRKIIFNGLALAMCLFWGCKKDKQDKIYLLRQEVIDYSVRGDPIDTITYTYDDHNRITHVTEWTAPDQIIFNLVYDSNGHLITAARNDNSNGQHSQYTFSYNQGVVKYYYSGNTHPADTGTFIANSKGQFIKLQTTHSGYQQYTYDDRGNLTISEAFLQDGTNDLQNKNFYLFDDKRNALSGMQPNNYFLMYLAYHDHSTFVNNLVRKNADVYSYTYNSDGFPVKGGANLGAETIPITFTYLVK